MKQKLSIEEHRQLAADLALVDVLLRRSVQAIDRRVPATITNKVHGVANQLIHTRVKLEEVLCGQHGRTAPVDYFPREQPDSPIHHTEAGATS